jgi:hypothetical protein
MLLFAIEEYAVGLPDGRIGPFGYKGEQFFQFASYLQLLLLISLFKCNIYEINRLHSK